MLENYDMLGQDPACLWIKIKKRDPLNKLQTNEKNHVLNQLLSFLPLPLGPAFGGITCLKETTVWVVIRTFVRRIDSVQNKASLSLSLPLPMQTTTPSRPTSPGWTWPSSHTCSARAAGSTSAWPSATTTTWSSWPATWSRRTAAPRSCTPSSRQVRHISRPGALQFSNQIEW